MNRNRRNFLKFGGAAAAGLTLGGLAAAGVQIGRSGRAIPGGGANLSGKDQFFDRKPFEVDVPVGFEPAGPVTRPHYVEHHSERRALLFAMLARKQWNPGMGPEVIPGVIGDYYRARPDDYAILAKAISNSVRQAEEFRNGKHIRYALANAYTTSYNYALYPDGRTISLMQSPADYPDSPPAVWDYRHVWRKEPLRFKSPRLATELIKTMAHQFGATLVGIAPFDPTFMFTHYMRGVKDSVPPEHYAAGPNRGRETWGTEVPEHWKSIIVIGTPMNWELVAAAPGYNASTDGYTRMANVLGPLERYIQDIGYPSRVNQPYLNYELIMPPYGMLAGLGESARHGILITPELGSNVRLGAVITNIEFEYDKPIDFGVSHFCRKCKICAETCPTGAISFDEEKTDIVRGFKRYPFDSEKCFLGWASTSANSPAGCRICMGVCPYTRKNTWIHSVSRELDARDPTGLVSSGLLAMQKGFFSYPSAQDFKSDWDGGVEATYHNPPRWMRPEVYFDVEKNWTYYGME